MKELLIQYKQLTLQQIDYLEQNNYEDSLRIVKEKNTIFLRIQKVTKNSEDSMIRYAQIEKQLVIEISELNEKAVNLMKIGRVRLSNELSKLKVSRQAQDAYVATYTEEAYFFDSQK